MLLKNHGYGKAVLARQYNFVALSNFFYHNSLFLVIKLWSCFSFPAFALLRRSVFSAFWGRKWIKPEHKQPNPDRKPTVQPSVFVIRMKCGLALCALSYLCRRKEKIRPAGKRIKLESYNRDKSVYGTKRSRCLQNIQYDKERVFHDRMNWTSFVRVARHYVKRESCIE